MSLNSSHADGGVLIFSGERILIYYDGIEFHLDPDTPRPEMKGAKKGRCYLTSHRVIFNNTSKNDALQSFSIPFLCMRQVELEQPVFGANYIKGKVLAEEKGNWSGSAKFKFYFTHGGAIEFGQAMLMAGKLADKNRRGFAAPPPYEPPMGGFFPVPPPAYTPSPNDSMYAFVPYQTFPNAPPADSVYMMQAPPPYPGVDPNPPPYCPAPGQQPAYNPNMNGSAQMNGAPAYGFSNGYPQNGVPPYPYGGPPYPAATAPYPSEQPPPYVDPYPTKQQ